MPGPMPVLTGVDGRVRALLGTAPVALGSAPGPGGLALPDPACASLHATVQGGEGAFWITAAGGAVLVNDAPVASAWLSEGDRIQVGGTVLVFRTDPPPAAPGEWTLVEEGTGRVLPLHEEGVLAGGITAVAGPRDAWFRGAGALHNGTAADEGWLSEGDRLAGGGLSFQVRLAHPPAAPFSVRWIVSGLAAAFLAAGIVLAILLAAPSGEWRLLPAMARTLAPGASAGRLAPVGPPSSGSAPVDLEAGPGVRLTAPAGALDKPRELRARPLDREALGRAAGGAGLRGAVPLAAVEVDSGMAPNERYPGEVDVAFDLQALGVPEPLWDTVRAVQVEGDGTVLWLNTERSGRRAATRIDRNSVIILAGVVLIPAGIAYWVYQDRSRIPGGPFISFAPPDCPEFVIHLGTTSLPWRRPQVVADTVARMNAKRTALGLSAIRLTPNDYPYLYALVDDASTVDLEREARLREDAGYRALEALWADPAWVRENVVPLRVHWIAEALKHGRDYLKGRGFRWPTYVVEVFVPDRSMTGFGYMENLWTERPYLILNPAKVPASEPGPDGWAGEAQGCWDNLNLTVMHELFHVVQTRYFWIPEILGGDLWFFEATAVALEGEAEKAYRGRSDWNVKSWHGTVRDYAPFRDALDRSSGDPGKRQSHGYGASYFLEHLRDAYYPGAADAFLPKLMEDYSALRGGRLNSLYRVTSGSDATLGEDFRRFCRRHAGDLFADGAHPRQVLTAKDPYHFWAHDTFLELRSPVLEVLLKAPAGSPKDLEEVVLAALDEAAGTFEMAAPYQLDWWDPFTGGWGPCDTPSAVTVPKNWVGLLRGRVWSQTVAFSGCQEIMKREESAGASLAEGFRRQGIPFRFQRIEHTLFSVFSSWNRSAGKGVHVFALFKPKTAPRFTPDWEKKKLKVEIPPSILAEKKVIEGYVVTVERWMPAGAPAGSAAGKLVPVKPKLQFLLKRDEKEIDIQPLLEPYGEGGIGMPAAGLGLFTPLELQDMLDIAQTYGGGAGELRITYREAVAKERKFHGPESDPFTLPIQGGDLRFDAAGTWAGKTWIVRMGVELTVTGMLGQNLEGTWSFSGSSGGFSGDWEPAERGWKLTLWVEERQGQKDPVLFQPYLRPLPGNRLWLAAPPAVLRNPRFEEKGEAPGWWDRWFGKKAS